MPDLSFFGVLTYYTDSFGFRCCKGQSENHYTQHGKVSIHRDKIIFTPQEPQDILHPQPSEQITILPHTVAAVCVSGMITAFGEYSAVFYTAQDDRAELCSIRAIDRSSSSKFKRLLTMFLCDSGFDRSTGGIYIAPSKPSGKKRKFYNSII